MLLSPHEAFPRLQNPSPHATADKTTLADAEMWNQNRNHNDDRRVRFEQNPEPVFNLQACLCRKSYKPRPFHGRRFASALFVLCSDRKQIDDLRQTAPLMGRPVETAKNSFQAAVKVWREPAAGTRPEACDCIRMCDRNPGDREVQAADSKSLWKTLDRLTEPA